MHCIETVTAAIVALSPSMEIDLLEEYASSICSATEGSDIDPVLVVSLAFHESGFRHRLKNRNRNGSIDYGPLQFNCPNTDSTEPVLKWRRFWCGRTRSLLTIDGGIRAGVRELEFWRDLVVSRGGVHQTLSSVSITRPSLSSLGENILFCLVAPPRGPTTAPAPGAVRHKYLSLLPELRQKFADKKNWNWWMKRYNWNSRVHWLLVLYIYRTLLERREDNYVLIRDGYHKILAKNGILKDCVIDDDMCLERYEKWRERRRRKQSLRQESLSLNVM